MITQQLLEIKDKTTAHIHLADSLGHLDDIKTSIVGKKGLLTDILKSVASLPKEERPSVGKEANLVKQALLSLIAVKQRELKMASLSDSLKNDTTDVSLPGVGQPLGHRHPIQQTIQDIIAIFERLGFSVHEGPDIETEGTNFEALNIRKDHPARDMHDTFYLTDGHLLRTHTSPVQIRTMIQTPPPIRMLAPGKVYRCDADTSHSPVFHQIEGLYVNKEVTFSELKGCLEFFLRHLFGHSKKVRFRPSYFPFTEPSAEVDVECVMCHGKGCSLCKQTGWLEILGAGMVQRHVFRGVNYDPDNVTGFAFGVGIERVAMLRYGIPDIRLFYENNLDFLTQF